MSPSGPSPLAGLREELETRVAGRSAVERAAVGESIEYRVRGEVVCVAAPDGVSFRLGTSVARAALKTPDVGPSSRGPGWVRFAPAALDRFALDRATSWFDLAVRLAGTAD